MTHKTYSLKDCDLIYNEVTKTYYVLEIKEGKGNIIGKFIPNESERTAKLR